MPNFGKIFAVSAGLASIGGLVLFMVSSFPAQGWIALGFVLLIALYVAHQILSSFKSVFDQKYPKGHSRLATFCRYKCLDGKTLEYSVYRIVQAKRTVVSTVTHEFKWSGTKQPQIDCAPHGLEAVQYLGSDHEFDKIVVRLKDPILFNQVTVIPLRMVIDDSDQKSSPFLMMRVDEPSQLITFRVELGTTDRADKPARMMKRQLESKLDAPWVFMYDVLYHPISKSYETEIVSPPLGYMYRLSWER